MVMNSILSKIDGYKESLRQGGSKNKMRDSWRKIGRTLFKEDELHAYKEALNKHVRAINLLLHLSNGYVSCSFNRTGFDFSRIELLLIAWRIISNELKPQWRA
jgi:hypothetical protein